MDPDNPSRHRWKIKNLTISLTKNPPEQTNENYETWEQEDLIVFSWLIQNIKSVLADNLTEYYTPKELWDALNVACRDTQKNSVTVLSVTRIGGSMATKRVQEVPKPRKKRFLPPILAPSTKKTQVMAGDQMVVLED
nr:putative Gag-polypeptide of LTR copia-type [Tanacetum cinerariifolium]